MVRSVFSFDGVDAGVVFIDGNDTGSIRHRLKASYAARAHGANWSRQGVVEGELDDFGVTVDSSRVVTVASGLCYVEHTDGIKYAIVNEANKTLTIPASSGGVQITAIYVTIDTTTIEASIAQVRAAAGAGNPLVPANSLVLAYVSVPVSGDPTVSLPATRFATPKGSAATATSSGDGGTATAVQRTIQRPTRSNVTAMFNDRLFTRNATRMWALDGSNNLVEFELGDYGFVRNDVANRTFGGSSAGKPLLPYWDAANGNLWAIKGDRGHIVESDTASRVTTGSSSISLTEIETGAPVTFAAFGNGGGLGVQSGGKYFIVGSSGAGNDVAIAEVSLALTIGGGVVQLVAGSDGIVEHTANAASPITFAAPGDGGSVLAGFITSADLSFHTQAQNGRVEQWSATGTKDATFASMPSGTVFGEAFDMAESATQGTDYRLGPAPNQFFFSSGGLPGPTSDPGLSNVPAGWLAAYDANPTLVILRIPTSTQGANYRVQHRSGGAWASVDPPPPVEAYPGSGASAGATGSGVQGIMTLTRIDGVLCYASAELIIPVINPAAQDNFWPYG